MPFPNILLLTMDNTRADRTGFGGYRRPTTPNLDALARQSVTFTQDISAGGQTLFAFEPILASVYPPMTKLQLEQCFRTRVSLPQILQQSGYRTGAFLSNMHNFRFYHYDQGFDYFDDTWSPADLALKKLRNRFAPMKWFHVVRHKLESYRLRLTRYDVETNTTRALAWLKQQPSPFFLWMHVMDVHPPYVMPRQFTDEFCSRKYSRRRMFEVGQKRLDDPEHLTSEEKALLSDLYDASVKHVDSVLSGFIGQVMSFSPPEKTAVIVTADHGDPIGIRPRGDDMLYDECIRVPLFVKYPGCPTGRIMNAQVSSLQLTPTILDLAGLPGHEAFRGRSLLPLVDAKEGGQEAVVTLNTNFYTGTNYYSCRTERWKLLYGDDAAEELYDLEADPAETRNLVASEKSAAAGLRTRIENEIALVDRRYQAIAQHPLEGKT